MEVSPVPVPGRDPRTIDAYTPTEVAQRVRTAGVEDAHRGIVQTFWLAVIGGSMLGLAAAAATAATAGSAPGVGLTRVVGGLVFGLGLGMVMTGGGELFTSNNLIAMAWVSRQIRSMELAVNWVVVYVGNAVGAISIVLLLTIGGAYTSNSTFAGQALTAAATKSSRAFEQDIALGILGNTLVCLAVWVCFGARSTTDRMVACVLPMMALYVLNVDHVVANLHYLAAGLVLRTDRAAIAASGLSEAALDQLTLTNMLANLAGVTIGNVIGGSVLVAAVYWFVYLRPDDAAAKATADASPRAGTGVPSEDDDPDDDGNADEPA